jgi:DSBA-like thioredoxin domain
MVLIMRLPLQSPLKLRLAPADLDRRRRNLIAVASSVIVIALMGALTYYSVPLYRLFCQATGLGGTTQVAVDRLKADMEDPAIAALIGKNLALAQALRIDGTPGFVAGRQVLRGAIDLKALQAFIEEARDGR